MKLVLTFDWCPMFEHPLCRELDKSSQLVGLPWLGVLYSTSIHSHRKWLHMGWVVGQSTK